MDVAIPKSFQVLEMSKGLKFAQTRLGDSDLACEHASVVN